MLGTMLFVVMSSILNIVIMLLFTEIKRKGERVHQGIIVGFWKEFCFSCNLNRNKMSKMFHSLLRLFLRKKLYAGPLGGERI